MSGSSSTTSTRALSVIGLMLGAFAPSPRTFRGLLALAADRDPDRTVRQIAERRACADQVRVPAGRVAILELHARRAAERPARARVGHAARRHPRRLGALAQEDRVLNGIARLGRELVRHAALGRG